MGLKTKLILIAVMLSVLGIVLPITEFTEIQYINATSINTTGMGTNSGNNVSLISEINAGFWFGNESTTPWFIDVVFTNISSFDFLEIKSLYFSNVGAPSTHEVDIEIWCITENAFVDLYGSTVHAEWQYFTRHFPDDMHFIDNNSNVTIRFNHTSAGNTNHRMWIDTVRLIREPTFISSGSVASGSTNDFMSSSTMSETNYIQNGNFNLEYDNWIFYTTGDTTNEILTAYPNHKSYKIHITSPGNNTQLYQKDVFLQKNTSYNLSFAAKSSTNNDIAIKIVKHPVPFTEYVQKRTFNLNNNWTIYNYNFNTTNLNDDVYDGRFQFIFNISNSNYYLDEISLTKTNI